MPRRVKWGGRRKRLKGGWRFLLVLAVLILALLAVDRQLAPLVESLARQQAHSSALIAMEEAVRQTLQNHPEYQEYQQLIILEKDTNGHVAVMIPNTMRLNEIVSVTTLDMESRWQNLNRQNIYIPAGALLGSKVLAGLGPQITFSFSASYAPVLALKDQFISAGINQTHHRIWLDMKSEILISAPFSKQKVEVKSSMLLAESVIVGPIPETYLNFTL